MQIKKLTPLILVSALIGLSAQASEKAAIATVNGEIISQQKVTSTIDSVLQERGTNIGAVRDPRAYKKLQSQVLQVLTGQTLLWQHAKTKNYQASEQEVEQAVASISKQFGDQATMQRELGKSGFDEVTFKEDVARQIVTRKFIEEELAKSVDVSEAQIDQYYQENPDAFQVPEQISARHILIKLESKSEKESMQEARKTLNTIQDQLKQGADFGELAEKHSQDVASAERKGDLGYFPRGYMVPSFEQAAFGLEKGQVSDIVETPFGLHLIQLTDRKAPTKMELNKPVRARIYSYLKQRAVDDAIQAKVSELTAKADIKYFVDLGSE